MRDSLAHSVRDDRFYQWIYWYQIHPDCVSLRDPATDPNRLGYYRRIEGSYCGPLEGLNIDLITGCIDAPV